MSEIKPVYQVRVRFNFWEDQTKEQYDATKFGYGVSRILYPAAAYKALQKENAFVINDLHIARSHIGILKSESAAQAKRIASLIAQHDIALQKADQVLMNANSNHDALYVELEKENSDLKAKVAELEFQLRLTLGKK